MRPSFRIITAAAIAGALSGLSVFIGFPLEADYIAAHYLLPSCSMLGSWTSSCRFAILSMILVITASSLLYLLKALRRIKMMLRIPGWIWGLALYLFSYSAAASIVVAILKDMLA